MSTPSSDKHLYQRLTRLDAQIKMEFDLIGLRISWLLVSNSFLFTAYVVALNNSNKCELNKSLIHYLISWALPLIGLVSSFLVVLAVRAALDVIDKLKELRDKAEDEAEGLGYERLGVSVDSRQHKLGNWLPTFLPFVLIAIWARLFYMTATG